MNPVIALAIAAGCTATCRKACTSGAYCHAATACVEDCLQRGNTVPICEVDCLLSIGGGDREVWRCLRHEAVRARLAGNKQHFARPAAPTRSSPEDERRQRQQRSAHCLPPEGLQPRSPAAGGGGGGGGGGIGGGGIGGGGGGGTGAGTGGGGSAAAQYRLLSTDFSLAPDITDLSEAGFDGTRRVGLMMTRWRRGATFGVLENKLLAHTLLQALEIPQADVLYGSFATKALGAWPRYNRTALLRSLAQHGRSFVLKSATNGGNADVLVMTPSKWAAGGWTKAKVACRCRERWDGSPPIAVE